MNVRAERTKPYRLESSPEGALPFQHRDSSPCCTGALPEIIIRPWGNASRGRMATGTDVATASESDANFRPLGYGLTVVQRAAAGLVYPANLASTQAQPEGLTWLGFEIGVGIDLDTFSPQLHS